MTAKPILQAVNHDGGKSENLRLIARPKTDIVAIPSKPELRSYQFTSPIWKVSIPAEDFHRARVTILWNNANGFEFDQAGLIFIRPKPGLPEPSAQNQGDADTAPSYVKFGLEQFQGAPICAVGASNPQLDWSASPVTANLTEVTVEFVRYGSKLVACVFQKSSTEGESSMSVARLLSWPLEEVDEDDPPIWIGVYAARPDLESKAEGHNFIASFTDFEIELKGANTFQLG